MFWGLRDTLSALDYRMKVKKKQKKDWMFTNNILRLWVICKVIIMTLCMSGPSLHKVY